MIFPECSFLPFARNCSQEIKKSLNPTKYKYLGRRIIQVSETLHNCKVAVATLHVGIEIHVQIVTA